MTGCIALRKDIYYVRLSYYDKAHKRKDKWISTGLSGRGANQKATAMIQSLIEKYSYLEKSDYPSKMADYLLMWKNLRKNEVAETTFDGYHTYIDRHLVPYFKDLNLDIQDITAGHIFDYVNYLSNDGGRKDNKIGGQSATSIRKIISILRQVFEYAVLYGDKVPKAHLNNNKYKVGSFIVEYSYTNPSAQVGRYYSSGDYVVSKEYLFEDRSKDSAVNIVACPNTVSSPATTNLDVAQKSASALGTSPTLYVFNGDIVLSAVNDTADLRNIFATTSKISGGIHPVVFSRGNSECRGYYATDIIKYIPTATGEFYFDFIYGEYHIVNLDTTEDASDGDSKFSGRVSLASVRSKENLWVNSIPKGKIIVISHLPLSTFKSTFACDWETALKGKGAVLALCGNSTEFSLKETVNLSSIYTITAGGGYWTGSAAVYTSSSIIVSDNYAYIKSAKFQNESITYVSNKSVSLTNGSTMTLSATQPPKNGNTYTLSTPDHIKWLSNNCTSTSSFSGYTFVLANDIDMMLVPVSPIGGADSVNDDNNTTSKGFSGIFDGNKHKIKNLNISTGHNGVGLFGVLRNATVKNLTLDSGYISGGWFTGGIAGFVTGSVIKDCSSDLTVFSVGGSKIGGIAGFIRSGTEVNRCSNYGAVITGHSSGSAGGIVGQISGTQNKIYSSFNRGIVVAHGDQAFAGGIFGYVATGVGGEIKNCYNAAHILGYNNRGAIFASCSSSSNVSISNTYFAQGFYTSNAAKGTDSWSTQAGSGTIKSKTQSEMKTQSMANTLSSADYVYVSTQNDGFPVHSNAPVEVEVPTKITLSASSKLTIRDGYLYGITEGMTVSQIRSQITNEEGISISSVGTGKTITLTVGGKVTDQLTMVLYGDIDGDGAIISTDYLVVKSVFSNLTTLSGAYLKAADVDRNGTVDTTDFVKIKSHFLGKIDLNKQ